MSLVSTSGFAIRRNGSCLASEVDCGATVSPFRACCPSGASCPSAFNVECCPSPANCTQTLLKNPSCANKTWTLYDNEGYFCCEPGTVGYAALKSGSDGCADPGVSLNGAEVLSVVSAGQSKTEDKHFLVLYTYIKYVILTTYSGTSTFNINYHFKDDFTDPHQVIELFSYHFRFRRWQQLHQPF